MVEVHIWLNFHSFLLLFYPLPLSLPGLQPLFPPLRQVVVGTVWKSHTYMDETLIASAKPCLRFYYCPFTTVLLFYFICPLPFLKK